MRKQKANCVVSVDLANPGQFFACCGLLELAHRLWQGAEGWFEDHEFLIRKINGKSGALDDLIRAVTTVDLQQVDSQDDYSSPIHVPTPFNLRLDWWNDEQGGGKRLKVWAGSMRNVRIARAMQHALRNQDQGGDLSSLFSYGIVVYESDRPDQKVEPFYFDSRRGSCARSIDTGFTPDTLEMTTVAYPATELLCLIGLQRCRPSVTETDRVFDYFTWSMPLSCPVTPAATSGLLANVGARGFRFENGFRTGQKKHKCFLTSSAIGVIP
jgi:CRISPR-associated protein Csb3